MACDFMLLSYVALVVLTVPEIFMQVEDFGCNAKYR